MMKDMLLLSDLSDETNETIRVSRTVRRFNMVFHTL
jgi:hypothetical protein